MMDITLSFKYTHMIYYVVARSCYETSITLKMGTPNEMFLQKVILSHRNEIETLSISLKIKKKAVTVSIFSSAKPFVFSELVS